ncbi:MAG TPA: primosomal protein N' [Gemmatimonadales bacterium]|nr:primosomal protein N' [Gemmatimonadales bacterium]
MTGRFVRVALPLPVPAPYTYRVPDALADLARAGARAVVPVRQRELIGIITDADAPAPAVEAKPLLAVPDPEPALAPALLRLAEWMAGYYGAPPGLALKVMLPGGMWGRSEVVMALPGAGVERGLAPREVPGGRGLGGTAGEVLRWLAERGGEATGAAARRRFRREVWDVAERLRRAGAVELRVVPPDTGASLATERVVRLAGGRLTLLEREERFRRQPRRRELYEALEELGGMAPLRHLREHLAFGDGVIRALVAGGLAELGDEEVHRDPFAGLAGTPPPGELTADQVAALGDLEGLGAGAAALLFGVTGSGKTLVYLEHIRRALAAGRGAIILVPEIGLTPQTVARVRGAFGEQVAVLHSGLSDGERADAWRALRRGERRVAVGARSALFAPVRDLGVIVVDEEHEASYKNGESPRYHARDAARVRARLEGAHLILGTATPSLESWTAVAGGTAGRLVRLPARVGLRPLPPVELVDLRTAPRVEGTGAIPWSEALDRALGAALGRREQALLFLNRRGFASFLQCPACGSVRDCPNCSISLTLHQAPERLRCHYCGHEEPRPAACARCGEGVERMRGFGTQQLERLVADRFPEARLARMDLDATSTKWAHHRILGAVEQGEVDILVGTQMVAKGLDFPNVTLVGVVDADVALHLPDFRSAERTFQLLAQVAGRAGRGPKGGRVLVQTRDPTHHALRHAATHDVEGFLAEEADLRRSPPYPPVTALVNVVASGPEEAAVADLAAAVAAWAVRMEERHVLGVGVLGPAPCPISRIKDRHRWHVALRGEPRAIGRYVRALARRPPPGGELRLAVDRDPVSLL